MSHSTQQQLLLTKFAAFKSWEDRYRHILRSGKAHPSMPDELKSDDVLLNGCESNVWFYAVKQDNTLTLTISSDAKIVKGLISIIVGAYQDLTLAEIAAFDCENFFIELSLLNHLSPSRGNGIRAIISAIQHAAS